MLRFYTVYFLLTFFLSHAGATVLQQIVEQAQTSHSDSLAIEQNGQLIYQDFFGGRDEVRNVQSISKSVSALAIELLLDQGKIHSLDQPMSDWIPSWKSDPVKSKITLRMILTQTSGMPGDSNAEKRPDWNQVQDAIELSTKIELDSTPGKQFLYSSLGSNLLQTVISQAAGQSVTEFLDQYLFFPIGITDAAWTHDKKGHEFTGGGLYLSTSDLLKLGRLMLQRGRLNGRSILSDRAVTAMTSASVSTGDYGDYGLSWWIKKPMYFAIGFGGQYLIIYPEKNLVVVRTNAKNIKPPNRDRYLQDQFYEILDLVQAWP